jgi:hypothetical protein
MSWDDLSPQHKALAFDGLAQMFGQANWQRELRSNPEGLMLATLQVLRGPDGLELSGWLDPLRDEMTIYATWHNSEKKRYASGFRFSHCRDHEELHQMIAMTAQYLSHGLTRESGKPTVIHCLSFREAYDVLERKRSAR